MSGRPSPKQNEARMRNWGIRNLRALHALAGQLSTARRLKVHALIDEELAERGALTTAQLAEKAAARPASFYAIPDEEIPF